ncbi:MAG: MMPL family transporter [Gordonia sp. (in: high G+C Gram-positive bacteria)]|uniref:MMPL family transporter n=1 Tax=Gordonia sp. (in: high G+C Gram-positive bacteria) TaxID=84139 RepID=UPI0039E2E8A6
MFGWIGDFVYRLRYAVIAVMVVLMAGLGIYGLGLPGKLSQSGWFDPTSESVKGSEYADSALGRDHKSDIVLMVTPPDGQKITDAEFQTKVENFVNDLVDKYGEKTLKDKAIVGRDHPGIYDPFNNGDGSPLAKEAQKQMQARMFNVEKNKAFISIGVAACPRKKDKITEKVDPGCVDDTLSLANFKDLKPAFDNIDQKFDLQGTRFDLAGLQPIANAMSLGMEKDIKRAELLALPVVALMLLFVFGGVVAAALPVFIGGLTIAGSLGIMTFLASVTELNIFAQSVVTLIGLGIAIDYGLFIVSRFREELAEGYTTRAAVRRSVMTAGQTVWFSATIIIAAIACLLLFPQGFLKSVAYGAIASVALAAFLSITVLPAILAILGPKIDAFGLSFLRRTKTKQEVEDGFWGKLSGWVMKHPVKTAVPTVLLLLALIYPFFNINFGGISEKYLPPNNSTRQAQESFDKAFPEARTEEVKVIAIYDPDAPGVDDKLPKLEAAVNTHDGGLPTDQHYFTKKFTLASDPSGGGGDADTLSVGGKDYMLVQMSAGLVNPSDTKKTAEAVKFLRSVDKDGLRVYIAGTPTLTQDSMDAMMKRLPLMTVILVLVTGFLMFLAFGSVVLPIKAALVSALGLGSTLGILTWIFVEGHGASIANFTPGPLFAPVLVLIIAIVFGLSTDYEIFLLSRMVEARQKGASTTEAIRVGTAHTGRLITAAAAILVVVTGAFALSEIVMMKYIAFGMIAALILDATIIRMLLVPSTMKLLGDDCWWAPKWMQALQRKLGLGETILEVEPDQMVDAAAAPGNKSLSAGAVISSAPTSAITGINRVSRRTRRAAERAAQEAEEAGLPVADIPDDAPPATTRFARPDAPAEPEPTLRRPPAVTPSVTRSKPQPEPVDDAAPDTGAWRLGEGGIRFDNPAPTTPPPTPSRQAGPPPQQRRPQQPPAPPGPPPQQAPLAPEHGAHEVDPEGKRAAGNRDQEISVQDLLRRAREQGGS